MTDQERSNKAFRARQAWEEFVEPVIAEQRQAYTERLLTVATMETDPAVRAGKIGVLSAGVKVLDNIEAGLKGIIADGTEAERKLMQAREIEKLSGEKRRLLSIAPRY